MLSVLFLSISWLYILDWLHCETFWWHLHSYIFQASSATKNGLSLPLVPSEVLLCLTVSSLVLCPSLTVAEIMEQSFWPSPSGIPILKVGESGNNYSTCAWTETENGLSFPEGKRITVSRRWVKAECQNKNKNKTDVCHSPLSLPHVYLPVQSHATDWRLEF